MFYFLNLHLFFLDLPNIYLIPRNLLTTITCLYNSLFMLMNVEFQNKTFLNGFELVGNSPGQILIQVLFHML